MAKQKETGKKKNGVLKVLIGIGTVMLLSLCAFFYIAVFQEDRKQTENGQEQLTAEVSYVEDTENMSPIIKSGSEDNRKVTKIIEVVPHQICSAFPYMVDWGTAEDYNENLMVGYEGMRYIMFANLDGHIGGSKDRITRDGSPEKLYELFGYDTVEFHNAYGDSPYTGEWQSKYWRIYESDNNVMNVNGYFEYVGAGKGLYDIDTGTVVEKEDAAHYGIRYEMTAMDRKGSENPKGEYTVKDPVCYVAKDYMPAYNPDTSKIKQWTGYHYLLKFDCKSATSADYRIYHVAGKSTTNASLAYEYQAYLAEGVSWDNGYEYQSGGNYKPDQITAKSARDWGEANYAGKYLRVESSKNKDGAAGVKNGYFKLYDAVTDRTSITDDTVLYDVTFQEAVSGGSYVLSAAGVKKVIDAGAANGSAYSQILFDYVGAGKGNYDVSFIYAPAGAGGSTYLGKRYAASIDKITFNGGRYALASSVSQKEDLYVAGKGDYSKLVTSIDCKGITYDKTGNGRTSDSGAPAGVSMGLSDSNSERGSWIFHAVSSDESNGVTKVDNLGTARRIYVYNQNRKNCYYAHNRFSNNEWLKLLILMTNDAGTEPLAWQDYRNGSLTAKQIKEKYKDELARFDERNRIEIVQRTPGQLTAEEVEEADLIYFSEREGVSGMSNNNGTAWNYINEHFCGGKLQPFVTPEQNMHYQDDLSASALMAIYKYCMHDQTTALMLDMDMIASRYISDGKYAEKNIGKMVMMLDLLGEPKYFADFIDGYPEHDAHPDYSAINPETAEITVYRQKNDNNVFNMGKYNLEWKKGASDAGEELEPETYFRWDENFFRIFKVIEYDWGKGLDWGTVGYLNGWSDSFPLGGITYYDKDVQDDWTWYAPNYSTGVFNEFNRTLNIWKILHNRNSKESSEPVIEVTNADGSRVPESSNILTTYYYYLDGYSTLVDEDFEIDFRVNWLPIEVSEPNSLVSLTVEGEDGGIVASIDSPQYKTDYSCNVKGDFVVDGELNPAITSKNYIIRATDSQGKQDAVLVRFIVRESFMLN